MGKVCEFLWIAVDSKSDKNKENPDKIRGFREL